MTKPARTSALNTSLKIAVGCAVFLIAAVIFSSPILTLSNFTTIEQEETREDTLQVRNIIDAEIQQLSTTAADYAGWDDTYAFMANANPEYISSSLGEAFYAKQRLNLFCMIANDGKVPFCTAYNHHTKVHVALQPSLLLQLAPGHPLLENVSPATGTSGLLSLPEGLMMVASRPILTSENKGPSRGTLIIGRFLDHDDELRIGGLLNYDITLLNFASNYNNPAFMEVLSHLAGRNDVFVQVARDERISGYIQLPDIYGKVAGLVKLKKMRTIYHQAHQTIWHIILLYGVMCLGVFIAYLFVRNTLAIVHRNEQVATEQLRMFIEFAVDGIFSISSTGRILTVNSKVSEMTGYSREELLEMRFGQLFESSESGRRRVEELLRENDSKGVECTLVRKDGQNIFTELTSKKMPDDTIQCFMHDISARKAMERQLIEYHNRVNSMAIDVSLAEERERNRIAGELHDQVGPNLLLGKLKVDQLQARVPEATYEDDFEAIKEYISNSIQDIRTLTFQLRPPILANAGLEAALRWLAQDFEQHHGTQVQVRQDGEPVQLEYGLRVTLFQAVRELLLNVAKHAMAKHVTIALKNTSGTLVIIVEDDGVGFPVAQDYAKQSHSFGLFNTRQRIRYHGGQVHIDSLPDIGTRVTITIPLEPEKSPDR